MCSSDLREHTLLGTTEFANWKVTAVVAVLIVGFLFVWFRILKRGDETPV